MSFTHLHCHSHYSLLDGLSKIEPLVLRAKELGMASLALTDHGVMYGAVEFYNECKGAGIKPIIGMEAYIAPRTMADKEGKIDADYHHLILLAQNQAGYHNLMKLSTQSHLEGFYYKPRIDLALLKQYGEGLVCLSGCQRGEIARALMNRESGEAQKVLDKYLDIFGPERLFIEIQRNAKTEAAREEMLNGKLIALANANNLSVVATADCHYIYPEDAEAQDVMVCIGTGRTVNDTDRLDMREYDLSLKSPEKMRELFADVPEAVANTQKVADLCELEIELDQRYFPNVEIPDGKTAEQYVKEITNEKALILYGKDGALPQQVKERIDYEMEIICKKNFVTYFLMVADVVEGAHKIGAITNTRGSAAGSIVGRILGITNIDPLFYELPFERFLTMHRPTPPDIDLDIADNRRDEVVAYITQKYGRDKVAQIITFGTMMARAAVRDVGRALGVTYSKCDQIAKMIPLGKQGFHMTLDKALEMSPELKEIYARDPETRRILDIAKKMEGCARHASVHAAGIVITPTELTDYTPLQKEPDGEKIITQYDMYSLDVNTSGPKAVGVVKLDLLGIRNLSILETAVTLAQNRHNISIDIYNLPSQDAKTFKLLSDGLTFGVFQLGSSGMTRNLRELRPTNIFDISAMVALYRPGPMSIIPDYVARKNGRAKIEYFDPRMKSYLEKSLGLLVYQEDVLLTAIHIAGYSWEEADKLRKAMGKKIPAEMAKQKFKFTEGCVKNGMPRVRAEELFGLIEPFAAYGFGKAHAASYAMVSYQTAYMKANFPVEFMAALMTAESGDEDKIYEAVEECGHMGITVLPPDVNESLGDFTVVDDKTIRFGLNAIKNLGSDVIEKVIQIRVEGTGFREDNPENHPSPLTPHPFSSLEDFLIKSHTKNLNKKSWEALAKAGALDSFGERGQLLANTEDVLDFVRQHFKDENSGQNSLFGKSLQRGRLKLRAAAPATKEEMLVWEKEHLGMYVSAHPLDVYRKVLSTLRSVKSLSLNELGANVVMGGIISRLKKTLTRKNDPMAFFTLEDTTGSLEVLVFPKVMEKVVPLLADDRIVQVTGRLSDKDEELKLIAEDIKDLPNDEVYGMALSEMEKNKSVVLHMERLAGMEILNIIKEILQKHPGNVQVYLSVGTGQSSKKIKTQSLVAMSNKLMAELRTVPEIDMVDVD
ncbi:MAG: DNA polymerase III subunit alpha [Candidatus Doudnabacteria bacterium]|nr:DNA polymerase III subunit alpha [Candidatus Doudnabacteria bacterium]